MGKKKARAKDKPTPKPKSLRRQLRQAESDLGKAAARRDRAQARVDALSIIADEIRAQLAEVERAEAGRDADKKDQAATATTPKAAGAKKPAAKRKPATARSTTAKSTATSAGSGASAKPATSPKPATSRRKAASSAAQAESATGRKPSNADGTPPATTP